MNVSVQTIKLWREREAGVTKFDQLCVRMELGKLERSRPFEVSLRCCSCGAVFYDHGDVDLAVRCPVCWKCHFEEVESG